MSNALSTAAPAVEPGGLWRRAWAASLLFHLTATILLGVAVHQLPRGADIATGGSMEIELVGSGGDASDSAGTLLDDPAPQTSTNLTADNGSMIESPPAAASNFAQLPEWAPLTADVGPRPNDIAQPSVGGSTPGSLGSPGGRSPLAADIATATATMQPSASPKSRGGPFEGIGGGSRSTVEVFGVKGSGSKFVYLFDRSTSMEGAPLAAAKRQLIQSLDALKSTNQFQIIFFNTQTFPIDITGRGRMAFADDRSKRMAANLVGGVTAEQGTDRYIALKTAIAFQPDVIFFLTDADDEMRPSEVAEIARVNERTGAAICVIEFGRDAAPTRENFLKQLARESGGQYGYVNTSKLGR